MYSQVNFPLNVELADSLELLLPAASVKEKVDIMNGMSYAMIRHYSSKSDSLASISVQLAKKIGYREGLAKALFCKATNDYLNGKYIDAMTILYEVLNLQKEIADTNMIIETYYQIGSISYFSFNDSEEGLHCAQICLDYAKASGYKHWVSQMYSSMQYIYGMAGMHDSAYKYLKLYTALSKEVAVPRLEEAMVIGAYGRSYFYMGDYRNALTHHKLAWHKMNPDDIEERAFLAQLTYLIGQAYDALSLADSAFYYFNLGMELSRKNQHNWGSMVNSLGLARQYLASGDLSKSALYCDSSIYFGSQIDASGSFYGNIAYSKLLGMSGELYIPVNKQYKRFFVWNTMAGAYQILLRIKEKQGLFQNALQISRQLNSINDSIGDFQKRTEILDLKYNYQARQKDDQIMLLSQENQLQQFKINQNRLILFPVIAILVLLFLMLTLYLRQNRIKSGRKVIELEQKLFRSQMNPHFIFNSLTSIQNFILHQEDLKASVYLSKFSELVRSILNNSIEEQITLEQEISTIENYLELQKVRFPKKFDYVIDIDPGIDTESVMIPPMLAQPFIENAIEHGIKPKKEKGRIEIRIRRSGDQTIGRSDQTNRRSGEQIILEVEDDGIGREKAQELLNQRDKNHKSMATAITQERIAVLNRKLKRKITMEIIDLKDENGEAKGTRVVFGVPV